MGEYFASVPALIASIMAGYLLGALPLADQISRRHGVDIFSSGSGLAGASNVLHTVGKVPAFLVLSGDMGKGALAVIVAGLLGVEGVLQLVALAASVVGHWKSVFSNFRGGDGLATLGGAVIPLFGTLAMLGVIVAMLIALGGQKMPYSSLLGIVLGYGTIVALTVAYEGDTVLAMGFGGLAGLVLAYALNGHRRRRHTPQWDEAAEEWGDFEEAGGVTEQSGSSGNLQ